MPSPGAHGAICTLFGPVRRLQIWMAPRHPPCSPRLSARPPPMTSATPKWAAARKQRSVWRHCSDGRAPQWLSRSEWPPRSFTSLYCLSGFTRCTSKAAMLRQQGAHVGVEHDGILQPLQQLPAVAPGFLATSRGRRTAGHHVWLHLKVAKSLNHSDQELVKVSR